MYNRTFEPYSAVIEKILSQSRAQLQGSTRNPTVSFFSLFFPLCSFFSFFPTVLFCGRRLRSCNARTRKSQGNTWSKDSCLSNYPSVCLSVRPSARLPKYLSIHLSACPSAHPPACLSVPFSSPSAKVAAPPHRCIAGSASQAARAQSPQIAHSPRMLAARGHARPRSHLWLAAHGHHRP
jgi:hypothetical protein